MNLSTGKTYNVFTNGPVYRDREAREENVIDFSAFRQLQARLASRSFSVKYVLSGTEHYNIGDRAYAVGRDQYLLTNAFSETEVLIDSPEYVKGVCIELSPELLAEVAATHRDPAGPYPQKDMYRFLTAAGFFENKYQCGNTRLGQYLRDNVPGISPAGFGDDLRGAEFFYGLAERLITDQQEVQRHMGTIDAVKISTRKDLLNRLLKGKELMDDCYADKLSISEIARAATMSDYYFLRLFKKVFHCSPHRYLVHKRLLNAAASLHAGNEPISAIAYDCGFPDIHTFSKAYKKEFGRSPGDERPERATPDR